MTLKLVAQYGDACNFNSDPATMRHKYEVLREHCEAIGRDYDDIIRSTDINVFPLRAGEDPEAATAKQRAATGMSLENLRNIARVGTSEEIIAYIQSLVDAGANYVIVTLPRLAYDLEPLHRFAEEVIPHFS